jgi:hypothetical protein
VGIGNKLRDTNLLLFNTESALLLVLNGRCMEQM